MTICQCHICDDDSCGGTCDNFVCKMCWPDYRAPLEPLNGDAGQMLLHAKTYRSGDKHDVVGMKALLSRSSHAFVRDTTGEQTTLYLPYAASYRLHQKRTWDSALCWLS